MSAQPIAHFPSEPTIPFFEGKPVAITRLRVSGMSAADVGEEIVVSTDDILRIVGEFKVVGVRHEVDPKTGELVREHIIKPIKLDMVPFDPTDPDDEGIVRAKP